MVLIKFKGIDKVEEAETLRNASLKVEQRCSTIRRRKLLYSRLNRDGSLY